MIRILFIIALCFTSLSTKAQSWINLKTTEEVKVFYKLKKDNSGKEEIRIKMINQSKSNLNVDLEIGFYDAGVLDQRAEINDCLKKGLFNNLFRIGHMINSKTQESDGKFSHYQIQLMDLKTEKVDKCEVMEP